MKPGSHPSPQLVCNVPCSGGGMASAAPTVTAVVSPTASRQPRARSTGRSPAVISAATSSIDRPGRSTVADTCTSPAGTGPSTSTVMRVSCPAGPSGSRSRALASSADGGPTCCASANHGPVVDDVAWKRAPSGPSRGR
jgi:hypothetical protein